MQLRHIRPGTLEWNDAVVEDRKWEEEGLTPEEIKKLRAAWKTGEAPQPKLNQPNAAA